MSKVVNWRVAERSAPMPVFAAKSTFWREAKAAASEYLAAEACRGRPSVGDPRLQRKAAVILCWFAMSYAALLLAPSFAASLAAALSLALAAAALGFGVFHDANHRTLFRRPTLNLRAAQLCSVLLGPSRHFWVHKHQALHHRQPNVFGWDDDLETRGLLRLSPACAWEPRFRRQELKALLYYGLNTLEWLFWKDFRCLVNGRLNHEHSLRLGRREKVEFIITKGAYFVLLVLPPFLMVPLAWAAAAFIIFHLVLSWTLAAIFQVAHLTPEMEFDGVRDGDDWALHQLRTTANFATRSGIITWFAGGLNHQVEHHLFPNVAHTHYSGLRPIVLAVAHRHDIECHDLGNMVSALRKHFVLLKALGQNSDFRVRPILSPSCAVSIDPKAVC